MNTKTFHGTPSGDGGDLDAVGDEQRAQFLKEIAHTPGRALDILGDECKLLRHSGEANLDYRARLKAHVSEPRTVDSIRTATGSQLDTCGEKLSLPRVRSSESDGSSLAGYIESDTDYRARLLDKLDLDRSATERATPTDAQVHAAHDRIARAATEFAMTCGANTQGVNLEHAAASELLAQATLDAVPSADVYSLVSKLLAEGRGSQLAVLGKRYKLPRGSNEPDNAYRARLAEEFKLELLEDDTSPTGQSARALFANVAAAKDAVHEANELIVTPSLIQPGGRVVLSNSAGVIGQCVADKGESLLDVAKSAVAVLEGSLPWPDTWHGSPAVLGRLANPAHVRSSERGFEATESTLPDGPLFDAEDVVRLLVAFAGMSEAKARTVVNLYALPDFVEASQAAADESAQAASDHAIVAEHGRKLITQEVQVAQESYPDVLETFSRLVGGS